MSAVTVKMKRLALLALVAAAPLPARADASAIERALGGVEWKDGPSRLRLLGDQPDVELLTLLEDPNAAPVRRRRALAMLVYTNTPRSRAFVRQHFDKLRGATEGSPALELATLLPVAAKFGQVEFDEVLPLLTHAVANLRESAATALFTIDQRRARMAIRTHLLAEKDSGVRFRLTRLLER